MGGVLLGAALAWVLTEPKTIAAGSLNAFQPDIAQGELVFAAAGCASCHSADGAEGEDKLSLGGGKAFVSPFGTFHAPNISSHADHGIGEWSVEDLANALMHGTSPDGAHYYPAFPYTAYARMQPQDIVSLHAYMATLPAIDMPSKAHDIGFPFNIRRSLGGWKLLFANKGWVLTGDLTPEQERGRYLAEALGHCGECHTPRNGLGGVIRSEWLAGAPNPSGKGTIPNITPGKLSWNVTDIAYYLETGFTPDYDSVGGSMAAVVENLAKLPAEDRQALAAYLKAVPAHAE